MTLKRVLTAFALVAVSTTPATLLAQSGPVTPCVVVDNGGGTVDLPPPGCGYVSPSDLHMIIDGLPPGTTINVGVQHQDFFNVARMPGGALGGEHEQFSSALNLHLQGTGSLSGYNSNKSMQATCQTDTAPRGPAGSTPQSFNTQMTGIQGQLPPGDPDFDLLRITAGNSFGLPSPGHTTLTRQGPPGSNWAVDSFFDITYRIDFIGHSPGPLGGHSGSTTGTIRMQAGIPGGGTPVPVTSGLSIIILALLLVAGGAVVLSGRRQTQPVA